MDEQDYNFRMNKPEAQQQATQAALYIQEFFQGIIPGEARVESLNTKKLPVWARNAAKFFQVSLGSTQIILLVPNGKMSVPEATNLYKLSEKILGCHVLLLAEDLPPKARGTLVRMGVPHVVADRLIFAPTLGLAYGAIPKKQEVADISDHLHPVGLKLTAAYLLGQKYVAQDFHLSTLSKSLSKVGYPKPPNTLSRIFQHLEDLEIAESSGRGPHKTYRFGERDFVWGRLLQLEVKTVSRKVSDHHLPPQWEQCCVRSSDSALAQLSDLEEPDIFTLAMSIGDYNSWKKSGDQGVAYGDFGKPALVLELWKEDPTFLATENGCLNPIELALSMRRARDPRLQMALKDLIGKLKLNPELLWEDQS